MNNVIPAWILAIPDVGENVITPDGGLGKLIKKKDGMGVVCFCESIVKTYHLRDLKRDDGTIEIETLNSRYHLKDLEDVLNEQVRENS